MHDVAEAAGASRSVVRQLHLAGWIEANVVHLPSGRQAWSVPATEIKVVKACIDDGINLQEAAKLLSLPKHRVRELIEAGIIHPKVRPQTAGATAWLLSRGDIHALVFRCHDHAAQIADPDNRSVLLQRVLKTWRLEAGDFPALIQGFLSGAITVLHESEQAQGFGGLLLLKGSLRIWLDQRRLQNQDWLSINDASHLLSVKQQVAYELVKNGLLVSKSNVATGKHQYIERGAVVEFMKRYVSLAEISRAMGAAPRALLRSLSVRPVCGPTIDTSRQYFFLRSDITSRHREG